MVKRMLTSLADDFPDYSELNSILGMAKLTWQQFGISAGELSEIRTKDPNLYNLLLIAIE